MSKYLFSSKIKCNRCGKNYKGKMYNGKKVYICSGYSNYGKDFCISGKVDEEDLLFLIGEENINNVECIYVDKNVNIKVVLNDNSELFWDNSKLIR